MDLVPVPDTHWEANSDVDACPLCNREFTFTFRRHHCRFCGRVVCANCSDSNCQTLDHGRHRGCLDCIQVASIAASPPTSGEEGMPDRIDLPRPENYSRHSSVESFDSCGSNASRTSSVPPSEEALKVNPFDKVLEDIWQGKIPKEKNGVHPSKIAAVQQLDELIANLHRSQISRWLTHEKTIFKVFRLCNVPILESWIAKVSLFCSIPVADTIFRNGEEVAHSFSEYTFNIEFCDAIIKHIGIVSLFEIRSEYGDTIFNKIARNNKLDLVRHLIRLPRSDDEQMALLNCLDSPGSHGMTPLHSAIGSLGYKDDSKCFEMLELFLEAGVDVNGAQTERQTLNMMPTNGSTPLLYYSGAATCFDERVPDILLKYGADVAAVDEEGNNCLHNVASNHMSGDTQHGARFVAWLLDHQLCDAVNESHERTALQYACMNGKAKMVELLLKKQSCFPGNSLQGYLTMKDDAGQTPLHYTAIYSSDAPAQDRCARYLVELMPEFIEEKNEDGLTPMKLAVSEKNLKFDRAREQFYIGWDRNHEQNKTCKHHMDGGVAAVVLRLSLLGGEALTDTEIHDVLENRWKTKEVEEEKHRLRGNETLPWWWKFHPDLLRAILETSDVHMRSELYGSAKSEMKRLAEKKIEKSQSATKQKEIDEQQKRELEAQHGKIRFVAFIILLLAMWMFS